MKKYRKSNSFMLFKCILSVTFFYAICPHLSAQVSSLTKNDSSSDVGFIQLCVEGEEEAIQFAQDVTLHVVLHELGHALVREFDLPILGNEETLADAFATCYLTTHLPDRAFDVIKARTVSLMIEAKEVPREEWTVKGEHNSDARRAYQIVALALAADPQKYQPLAQLVGMTERDVSRSIDYGAEIHRSWRRMLKPLWMPTGIESNEARVRFDSDDETSSLMDSRGLTDEIEKVVKRFDWHSQITVHFSEGEGGAGWNRSRRTITVYAEYIQRFMAQGKLAAELSQ